MSYEPKIWKEIRVPENFTDYEDIYDRAVRDAPEDSTLVELGSWVGKSATLMLELIKKYNKKVNFYCVDNFSLDVKQDVRSNIYIHTSVGRKPNPQTEQLFRKHTSSVDISDTGSKFDVFVKDSSEASHFFEKESVYFVFIDADHSYPAVKRDIETWYPIVKRGGILAGHDFTWLFPDGIHGVAKAVWEFCRARSIEFSVSNNSWYIVKK